MRKLKVENTSSLYCDNLSQLVLFLCLNYQHIVPLSHEACDGCYGELGHSEGPLRSDQQSGTPPTQSLTTLQYNTWTL
ncbi:hypothetical protein DPMN_054539 [Dreissena polymorpha]|uniref:Uncharacterized protein n=1 Tax=Dreissena polymorpha TaxID=45954 RepID=A0A9D4CPN4_DREPO|nr:hypothetical protein DPMN_054539 [Dreissena polymorpha]